MLDYELNENFRDELLTDERIVWAGQPDPKVLFSRADLFLIPFGLLWCGFVVFWELSVLGFVWGPGAPIFMALFGIPFICIGIYFVFGRFIYKMYKKRRTFYALTNKRTIILIKKRFDKTIQAEYLNAIPSINKSVRSNGIGTVSFGNIPFMNSMYGNTGMDFFTRYYGQDVPIFYDIKDAEQVYKMANDLKNQEQKT